MSKPMMKCGHVANGTKTDTGEPVCVICSLVDPAGMEIDPNPPSLTGRTARCFFHGRKPYKNECDKCRGKAVCECEEPSSADLAFFAHKTDAPFDEFYCGCRSWD